MAKKLELVPVDLERCQAIVRESTPFRLGGPPSTETRCTNKPTWVATETVIDPVYGKPGAMSLCAACKAICAVQMSGLEYTKI